MKTFFICAERSINNHVGEEYDVILEVEDQPTTETISEWSNRIRGQIRALWREQDNQDDQRVVCYLDAVGPYHVMLINLQIIMESEEGIVMELPYVDTDVRESQDSEAQEVLEKLETQR